ncbi:MBL fold metallo-hydrolase [Streptomyces canus]|uniref:MBL fold metallo-hydrolase n=1 Tax=Streptomyces canus TaxID=58343 RepID=UPI00324D3F9E
MTDQLTLSVFTAPARPVHAPLPVAPPDGGWTWPPTAATLIAGEREAILVDTVPTVEDAQKLADWIEASGKELTTIYITHGHFDHFLGSSTLLDRFPQARVVATEATVRLIEAEAEPDMTSSCTASCSSTGSARPSSCRRPSRTTAST